MGHQQMGMGGIIEGCVERGTMLYKVGRCSDRYIGRHLTHLGFVDQVDDKVKLWNLFLTLFSVQLLTLI
jgi:hypothetical protein